MRFGKLLATSLIATIIGFVDLRHDAQSQLLLSARDIEVQGGDFPDADVVCKLKMRAIAKDADWTPRGRKCTATCDVVSTLKGTVESQTDIEVVFYIEANGREQPARYEITPGETYLALLKTKEEPYLMYAAMRGVPQAVEPTFGRNTTDLLLAELVAMSKSDDRVMVWEALEHIGFLRDRRASNVVSEFTKGDDEKLAREAMIAQYRMKIAPDAKRLMELFDPRVLDVWYQESGTPQRNHLGNTKVWRTQLFENQTTKFLERGVPAFDYATFVREGIKQDWVRKDEHTLYLFFGIPWKVQRKACVPELVKLLDHHEQRVRWWAVTCLDHTVYDKHESIDWKEFQRPQIEATHVQNWKTWWNEKGKEYLAEGDRSDAVLEAIRNIPELQGVHLRMAEHEFKELLKTMEFKSIKINRKENESSYRVRTKTDKNVKVQFRDGQCSSVELVEPKSAD